MNSNTSIKDCPGEIVLESADSLSTPHVPSRAFAHYEQNGGTDEEPAASPDLGALAELARSTLHNGG